jgi:hypothetical protein
LDSQLEKQNKCRLSYIKDGVFLNRNFEFSHVCCKLTKMLVYFFYYLIRFVSGEEEVQQLSEKRLVLNSFLPTLKLTMMSPLKAGSTLGVSYQDP